MRSLRRQLIRLLDQARIEQHAERVPPRIAAALVHDFMTLLPLGEHSEAVALRVRSISHRDIHRHIVTIRCPDQAFFLDAIKGYLLKKGITPLMQQTMVAMIECDERQCVLELKPPGEQAEANFMFIALHISATLVKDIRPCARDIHAILRAVHLSVRDFAPMRRHVADCATRLLGTQPDAGALLEWLNDNRYLYFGLRHRRMRLGLFRDARTMRHVAPGLAEAIATLPPPERCGVEWFPLPALHHYLYSAATVELARISWRADDGALAWTLVLGHFSRSARHTNASHTPVLAARWRRLAQSRLLRHSAFYQREIRTIYDRLPKPALLCTQPEDWLKPMRNTVDMANATDATCALLPPRTPGTPILYIAISALRYGPNTRQALFDRLRDEAGIVVHGHESIGIGPHRVILAYCDANLRHGAPISGIDITHVQHLISDAVTFWKDRAKAAILAHSEHFSVPAALAEVLRVPPLYEHLFPPEQLWRDIAMRQRIHQDGRIHIRLRRMDPTHLDIHVLSARPLLLGRMVNQIQAFGLLAEQESMVPLGNAGLTLHINRIVARANDPLDEPTLNRLHVGLERVFNKMADHDPLNELILTTGLSINEVAILITLRNYLIQLLPDAARPPLIDMLLKHAECSRRLIDYFIQLHHPHIERRNAEAARQAFLDALERVTTLTEDRWFRALEALVTASLRTNAFTRAPDAPIALKIDPRQLDFIPEPKPWRETFVHGVELEGIHLRAGPVARGGIRHSDRPADFRTEILELMDTQTIKNGQIVPTGAKGGFVTTRTGDAETVRRQYRVFIRSLLSITDNRQGRRIVPPAGIRIDARDRNDPYLVVAADKGTARFSDDANAIARECGFWLDDAFASGGSHGYDHKALGITARGAWVCAAEHFRRLGVDAWRDAISAVGIGDMSGDVFGNGMLLNPRLRLVAAFNHRHIFLDPQPDPARAFAERQRLFRAGLGWDAYRAECISTGGGVFDRSAKSIRLSAAARRVLGIDEQTLSGEALIRAILTAPVDLLYNGGIGTYVKDAAERHEEVRDPANNAVRVDAQQLRCKVVCEGGNLGFTQAARIAFAKAGGLINTDAIDNSAGVDMSDHEVNLKLLLGATPGVRMSIRERNRRLKALSDTVTRQCLNNNLLQSRALTVAEFDVALRAPRFHRLVELLQRDGWLIEPVRDFPRPTLAVLLGQEKNRIHAALNKENFAARSLFADALLRDYFPPVLQRRFAPHLADHPLAREITHTQAANAVVNHLGIAAVAQLQTLIDASMADIIEALLLAEHVLDARALVAEVWQTQAATDDAARLQQQVQEGVLQFAEELLRISDMHQWDAERMCALRTALRRFAAHHPKHASSASQLQRFAASAEMASALGAAEATGAPLSRAFNAARACFALIPFQPLERAFRSPLWGEAEAHALRRLCLHRLTRLKARAIATLLHAGKDRFQRHGERIWGSHPCWHHVRQSLDIAEQPDEESSRMRCLLLLNQIEALLGDNAAQLKQ